MLVAACSEMANDFAKRKPTSPKPHPQAVPNIYLSFEGVGFSSGWSRSFDVMVGDNPPSITGGYANWTNIKRPLQRALTVFTGYDPMQMTVEVRFGRWGEQSFNWQTDDTAGQAIEGDIDVLEWMAGSNFHTGPSPVVYVWSHGSQGKDTDLIPPQYAKPSGYPWVVTGLQWGKAWRNANGYRVWQEATIVLSNYLNLGAPPKPDVNVTGGYFVSKNGADTPILIAGSKSSRSPVADHRVLAGRICGDSKNNPCKSTRINLSGRSLSFKIRHGVPVWVPEHARN